MPNCDVVVAWVLSGKGTRLCGPVSTVPTVDGDFSSFTVEQAERDTRAAAARHATMSFFIKILVYIVPLQH
jgi:hypothetical protein